MIINTHFVVLVNVARNFSLHMLIIKPSKVTVYEKDFLPGHV